MLKLAIQLLSKLLPVVVVDPVSTGVVVVLVLVVVVPVGIPVSVVVLVVAFANIFTVIQPVIEANDWNSALWMVGGPIFFSLLAMAIYQNYCSRMANKPELALD